MQYSRLDNIRCELPRRNKLREPLSVDGEGARVRAADTVRRERYSVFVEAHDVFRGRDVGRVHIKCFLRIFCGSLDDIAAVRACDALDDFFRGGVNEVGSGLFAVRRGLFDDLVGVYARVVHGLREAAFRLSDFSLLIPLFQRVINDLDDFRLDRNTIARKLDRYRIAQ